MHIRTRVTTMATAVLAALALVPVAAASSTAAAAPPAATGATLSGAPAWGPCPPAPPEFPRDPRQECATLAVPLDYRHPAGRTIDIAISRIRTATPAQRRGILTFNPGGPGGSGLDLPSIVAQVAPPEVVNRYDLIGFDPRGIGHSTPVTCGLGANPDPTLILPYPSPDGRIARNVAHARATAAGCAAGSGDLLPHITTANTARDMDRIRAALGERKLSYLGISYGTYLGAVFTTLFPHRSDRIVLDSAVDPTIVWRDMWRTWGAAVALRFRDFLSFAAANDATYGLGATPAQVGATFDRIVATLDREPITDPSLPYALDGNLVREGTRGSLYLDEFLPLLAADLQAIKAIIEGSPADVAALAGRLRAAMPWGVAAPGVDVPVDNQYSALYAVVCGDAAWPGSIPRHARDVAVDRRAFPRTAGMPANVWPCAFWPDRPVEPPVRVSDRGPRNVLILQNTRDPATPLVTALGLRRALGSRAVMVTVDQGGHGTYATGTCADTIANAFLATGELPRRDRFCVGRPLPTGAGLASVITRLSPAGPL
jgi:pimeloyl-ACP methyl ester carboxylesterase